LAGGCGGGGDSDNGLGGQVVRPTSFREVADTWNYVGNNSSESSAFEFKVDGTYGFYSRFRGNRDIEIIEKGHYAVTADELSVMPESKLYNGANRCSWPHPDFTNGTFSRTPVAATGGF
jgi:hypothetical protein